MLRGGAVRASRITDPAAASPSARRRDCAGSANLPRPVSFANPLITVPTAADTIDPSATQPLQPNPPQPAAGRRVTCPVLWVHLHGYAEAGVHDQVRLRESLHAAAATALKPIPPDDRIVLETDTGMAVCFLGGAPLAAASALALLEASASAAELRPAVGLSVGPVAVLDDGDTAPRLIGDGVVVAERITAFAGPGQIVATRELADAVAPAKGAGARLFAPFGARTDAQLRSHDLVLLKPDAAEAVRRLAATSSTPGAARIHRHRWAAGTALAAVASLIAVFAGSHRAPPPLPRQAPVAVAAPVKLPEPPAVASQSPPPAPPEAAAPPAPLPEPEATVRGAKREATAVTKTTSTKPRPETRAKDPPKAAHPKPAAPPAPAAKSIIGLAVSPWGEVLINGRRAGVSPPLTMVEVDSGRVTIEVRNGESSPFTQTLDLAPGEEVRIKHRF